MDAYFTKLGREVLARWKRENFSLTAFPDIACAALEESLPSQEVDLPALIRDFLLEDEQPAQSSSGFGQPELIVYEHPRFYIQILFWLDGTTDIHQHEFSGAFHVLQGSSVHTHFEFENVQPVTAHFRLGDLRWKDTRLLEQGCTLPIVSGQGGIHALFHLETPSITVVVRTQSDPGTGPQFTYLPPHVGFDPVQDDALTVRRKQLLDALERIGSPEYAALVLSMLTELDLERGFFILQHAMGYLHFLGVWDETWEAFAWKHGEEAAALLEPSLREIIRRDGLVAMRESIDWVEHRFFLALLLTVPDRKQILDMVAQRFPGSPLETILQWAEELTHVSEAGTWMVDARFPEELEVSETEQGDLFLVALRQFVGGESQELQRELEAEEVAILQRALANSSWKLLAVSSSLPETID